VGGAVAFPNLAPDLVEHEMAEMQGVPFLLSGPRNVDLSGLGWKYVKEDPHEVWDRYYEPAEIERDPQRLLWPRVNERG